MTGRLPALCGTKGRARGCMAALAFLGLFMGFGVPSSVSAQTTEIRECRHEPTASAALARASSALERVEVVIGRPRTPRWLERIFYLAHEGVVRKMDGRDDQIDAANLRRACGMAVQMVIRDRFREALLRAANGSIAQVSS